jgi:hypothetical protein
MKKVLYTVTVISVILFNSSCSRERYGITKDMLSGKWVVQGSSLYESFEFNESGNYIVIRSSSGKAEKGSEVIYGQYEINNETVNLYDFGSLNDVEIEGDQMIATVVEDNSSTPVDIQTTKAAEYENSSRTDLLCRTWKIVSWNGQTSNPYDAREILFSRAGTYLVTYSDNDTGLSSWQWKDSNEQILCYNWYGFPTCTGANEVEISNLTNTTCTISEDDDIYKLEPASTSKSANIVDMLITSGIKKFMGSYK